MQNPDRSEKIQGKITGSEGKLGQIKIDIKTYSGPKLQQACSTEWALTSVKASKKMWCLCGKSAAKQKYVHCVLFQMLLLCIEWICQAAWRHSENLTLKLTIWEMFGKNQD